MYNHRTPNNLPQAKGCHPLNQQHPFSSIGKRIFPTRVVHAPDHPVDQTISYLTNIILCEWGIQSPSLHGVKTSTRGGTYPSNGDKNIEKVESPVPQSKYKMKCKPKMHNYCI